MIKRSQHPKHDLFLFLCCSEVTVKCEMYEYSFRDHPIRLMHFVFIYFFLLERNSSKPKKKKVVEIEAVFFWGPARMTIYDQTCLNLKGQSMCARLIDQRRFEERSEEGNKAINSYVAHKGDDDTR